MNHDFSFSNTVSPVHGSTISPRPLTNTIALSRNQERKAKLVEKMGESNLVYTIQLGSRIDAVIMEKTLTEVILRHEILRTSYHKTGGQLTSVINQTPSLVFRQVNLKNISDSERYNRLSLLYAEESKGTSTISELPNLRASVLTMDDKDILVFSIQHIAFDWISFDILTSELDAIYPAFSIGAKSPLSKLRIQYSDYAYWQCNYLHNKTLISQLHYWKDRLKDMPLVLDLPIDQPRPPIPSRMRGAQTTFVRHDAGVNACAMLAKSERSALSLVLLAVFMALLHAWTGQDSIVVRMPLPGRRRPEVKRLIGFFANLVPVCTSVSENHSFRGFIHSVREAVLEAYRNQDIPYGTLQDEFVPITDPSVPGLTQVQYSFEPIMEMRPGRPLFSVDKHELATMNPSELRERIGNPSQRTYKNSTYGLDLSLQLAHWKEGLEVTLTYNLDLFEHSTARCLIDRFHKVLERLNVDPDLPISKFLM